MLTFINRVKCYIFVQEIWECDSKSAVTTLPSAAQTPLFMFLDKKMPKKTNAKFRWGLVSASRKMLWFCARISILIAKSTW